MEDEAQGVVAIYRFTIVCAVDLGEQSLLVIEHALAEAMQHASVSLHMLTVVDADAEIEVAEQTLRELVYEVLPTFAEVRSKAERNLRFHVRCGAVHECIVELAVEARADTIVIGRFGDAHRDGESLETARKVVQQATCSVQVVRVPSYDEVRPGQCPACVEVRALSGGERWFCEKHSGGRIPRLRDRLGRTSYSPGWGIF